jgi:hypothetical protein
MDTHIVMKDTEKLKVKVIFSNEFTTILKVEKLNIKFLASKRDINQNIVEISVWLFNNWVPLQISINRTLDDLSTVIQMFIDNF